MSRSVIIILLTSLCLPAFGQLTATFSADNSSGCGPLVVHFTSQISGAITGAATYQWDLGNGNSAVEPNPQAVYTQPGTYTIILTVMDEGQSATVNHTVTVYPPPTA